VSLDPPMTLGIRERLSPSHRLTAGADYAALKASGRAFRGAHCLLVALAVPGEVTRVGFVASKRGVGGAVQRNRARRRLREIVRRRWPRVPQTGHLLMLVAHRSTTSAPHQDLASDVERLLAAAGALSPLEEGAR
jgi:ribonuclease P protein component